MAVGRKSGTGADSAEHRGRCGRGRVVCWRNDRLKPVLLNAASGVAVPICQSIKHLCERHFAKAHRPQINYFEPHLLDEQLHIGTDRGGRAGHVSGVNDGKQAEDIILVLADVPVVYVLAICCAFGQIEPCPPLERNQMFRCSRNLSRPFTIESAPSVHRGPVRFAHLRLA